MTVSTSTSVALDWTSSPRLATWLDVMRTWRPAHAVVATVVATALVVASMTGHSLDFAGVFSIMEEMSGLLVLAVLGLLCWRFVMIARERPPEGPTRALLAWLGALAMGENRWMHALNALVVVSLFALGFGILKGAIAILVPFAWDTTFMEMDRVLHGGRLPHEWLSPLIAAPMALWTVNFIYNLWYFIVLGALLVAGVCAGGERSRDHMRYAVSFMATWLVGGFFMAMLFSSAGPCFVGPLGLTGEYEGLMASLRAADAQVGLWALGTQDILLAGYMGERGGSLGISALPSMHVATATLLALYVSRFGRARAWAGWLFAAAIMLGSVALAWHYAVDGYAGALVAFVIWRLSALVVRAG